MLNTREAAALGNTTPATVKREIERGNLHAEKVGGVWVIQTDDAKKWAAQFKPYAGLYKRSAGT